MFLRRGLITSFLGGVTHSIERGLTTSLSGKIKSLRR